MPHMPSTGVSGVDLYARTNNQYVWMAGKYAFGDTTTWRYSRPTNIKEMKEKLETYFYTIAILGVGLASGIIMGFSPTIYASADRPYIYLYFILMAVCLFCIRQMRGQIRKEVPVLVLNMSAVILGLFCMVNIAETLWMCHIM